MVKSLTTDIESSNQNNHTDDIMRLKSPSNLSNSNLGTTLNSNEKNLNYQIDSGHSSEEVTNTPSSSASVDSPAANTHHHPHHQESSGMMMSGAIDSAVRKFGWLYKLSQNGLKLWRKRYFVLTDYILDYYSGKTRLKNLIFCLLHKPVFTTRFVLKIRL